MTDPKKNKGGRPRKKVKRQEHLAVMCNLFERKEIAHKAHLSGLTISEYLREVGINGKVIVKTFPKELLEFTGLLNHLAANINQLAKKRNQEDDLSAIERAELKVLADEIKTLAENIKSYSK
jgi:hypothetical protein